MGARIPSVGSRFAGRFFIEAELGRGGFGIVYRALNERTGQRCALKVLTLDALFDDDARRRFLDEARRTPWDRSPHVVQVYDSDVTDGVPWITMELLKGDTLGAHVSAHGPLSRSDFDRFFRELCHGVGAAHERGIVHRDLKPENVFLHRGGGRGWRVKVLDFGVAKQLSAPSGTASMAVRTDGWGAPEQSLPARISPAADVWSLGLIAYFALTGVGYFGDLARGETVVPASVRAKGQGVAERLPAGFDAWFARCVAWDPSARFASALEALAALPARPPARPRPDWGRRVALGFLSALLISLAAVWVQRNPSRREAPGAPSGAEATVAAWIAAMESNAAPDPALYAPAVRINGERGTASPEGMRRYWTQRGTLPGWSFRRDGDEQPALSRETALTLVEQRSCGSGPVVRAVVRMAQHHPTRPQSTGFAVPCETLRGRYRLRLRETATGWAICDETFLREELCASCPAARVCPR